MTGTEIDVHIRWMIRRDMKEVLEIEAGYVGPRWTMDHFLRFLRQRNCVAMVAEAKDGTEAILGYMAYALHKGSIELHKLAVHPDARRRHVGARLLQKLKGKLIDGDADPAKGGPQRSRLDVFARERDTVAHLFFREYDLAAIRVVPGHFDDTGEDAYHFRHEVPIPCKGVR